MRIASKIGLWVLIVVVAFGGLLLFRDDIPFISGLKDLREAANEFLTEELSRRVITPGPLRGPLEGETHLTRAGVVRFTNHHRAQHGLPPLAENQTLNVSASLKVDDMFANQYFAHESPNGNGVSDLADRVGYNYIVIGENLALGNFQDDETLVQAWMDSPGHRANILHDGYTEIGVSVQRGTFKGDRVWLAVQHFGKPESACPSPDETLKTRIENNKTRIAELSRQIEAKEEEIENTQPKYGPEYNRKVDEYNALVDEHNALVRETKELVAERNNQVRAYNECAQS